MKVNHSELADFIEIRSDLCEGAVLLDGLLKLSSCLDTDLYAVMDSIENHPYIPAIFLLEDLFEKINKQNKNPQPHCVKNLEILFDHCFDRLLESCVYTMQDLGRFVKVFPSHVEEILNAILAHEHQIQRILTASHTGSTEEITHELAEKFPSHAEQFMDYYNEHYQGSPATMRR